MCGLVGMAGSIDYKHEKMFRNMLILDVIRGMDSTGVASLSTLGQYKVSKAALCSPEFVNTKLFTGAMQGFHRILLGHNRAATKGAVNDENAHPFEFDNIIGAHNGTLRTYANMHDSAKYKVDSQALFSNINEHGIAETWKKMDGAAALTWIDKRDRSIHLVRNTERTLYYTTSNNGATLLWASEPWMLIIGAAREGIEIEKPQLLPEHSHLSVTLGVENVVKMETLEHYVAPKVDYSRYYGGYSSYSSSSQVGNSGKGQKFLDAESVKLGDDLSFSVDKIQDHTEGGVMKCTIIGRTLDNTPIRIYNVTLSQHEELISEMWMDDKFYRGKVSYANEVGIVLRIDTVTPDLILNDTKFESYKH